MVRFVFYLFYQVFLAFSLPRGGSRQQFVEYYAYGEYVSEGRIDIVDEGFRGHVQRSANVVPRFYFGIGKDSKSKISNFPALISLQYIGRFQIPMQDALSKQMLHPINNLIHDLNRWHFWYPPLLGYIRCQIAIGTQFRYYVAVGQGAVYV